MRAQTSPLRLFKYGEFVPRRLSKNGRQPREVIASLQLDLPDVGRTSRLRESAPTMHLLIIILQQLLGLLPNGEGKKAPQVELARPPRQNPHNSEPSPCLGLELPRNDWMTLLPLYGVTPVSGQRSRECAPLLNSSSWISSVALLIRSSTWLRKRTTAGESGAAVLRGPSGGNVHGGPFHSQNPEMWFVHTPGLKVVCPATAYDAKGLIKSAIRDHNPVIFFEHKYLYRRIKEEIPADDYVVPIGKARIAREGRNLSVITYAAMLYTALEAAEILSQRGNRIGFSTCVRSHLSIARRSRPR